MAKNPNWSRDELILALDLYFKVGRQRLDESHPEVIQLSQLLNQLPIHSSDTRNIDFRNSQGVSMKLGNFSALDPEFQSKGLKRGSKLDQEVWNEFAGDIEKLKLTAVSISKSGSWVAETKTEYRIASDDEEFMEGRILTRLHKRRKERNQKVVEQKKKKVLQETGKLECEACRFDFFAFYGKLGHGFAECHHTTPISELTTEHKTKLIDLAILCANCHRMIHRSRKMLTVKELREIITNPK